MNKNKNLKFEIVRGAASILLALGVAMIFIFVISKTPFEAQIGRAHV